MSPADTRTRSRRGGTDLRHLLVPSSALLWGLQISFLSPALALILVNLYGATTAEVGWVLSIYNASGFLASLALPAYADKKHDYLRPMLVCGALTAVLAIVLAITTTLPVATIALVLIGGPAGVGSSMLFAQLRHSGARPAEIVNTRAIVSVAWVGGPPLATFIIGWFGNRAILLAIAAVAVLNITTTAIMITHRSAAARATAASGNPTTPLASSDAAPVNRIEIVLIMAAFILLQATNATAMTIMTVYVTETLQLDVIWAGIALGVAAALEVPALLLIGRLSERHSHLGLIATGCLAGIAYYLGLAFVTGPGKIGRAGTTQLTAVPPSAPGPNSAAPPRCSARATMLRRPERCAPGLSPMPLSVTVSCSWPLTPEIFTTTRSA
ncbi:SET family sugar efflux transporter-like MFS transporter [Microlunatus panaciterrae]|uniref:SET family sugar efflux transporter-like MFS transporter n=1 Tax=Microlunatus panaciterrae TaxID=400768 RepID=A0ABS2RLN7_9ACTN|nr:MFS transporter [Microlunatus panaciterrae]MBM7799920.1 SET family sugar efflux transporter-like MFS transporter [Microlunatus panaciterrae]